MITIHTPSTSRTANRTAHRARLAQAIGDGAEWHYVGMTELAHPTGECACGQIGLRWLFHIKRARDGAKAILGINCVDIFQDVNPEMVETMRAELERIEQGHRDRAAAAKKAIEDQKVAAAVAELESILWQRGELIGAAYRRRLAGQWLPSVVYREGDLWSRRMAKREAGEPVTVARLPALKTPRGMLARIEGLTRGARRDLDEARQQIREG